MLFTAEQRSEIACTFNDFIIDHNIRIAEERMEWGGPDKQKIPVSDETLLSVILPIWKTDIFEMGEKINWSEELARRTGDDKFLQLNEEDRRPYRVRAGILLESSPEYRVRTAEQSASPSHIQTGSELAGYVAGILNDRDRV